MRKTGLNTTYKLIAITTCLSIAWGGAIAQNRSTPQQHKGAAETTLVGIALFDPGTKVIAKYGNPAEIQPLSIGGSGGAGGASGGGRSGPGEDGGGLQNGRPSAAGLKSMIGDPFDTGGDTIMQQGEELSRNPNAPSFGGDDGGGSSRGGSASMGAGGSTQGSGSVVHYTRWVYNRGGSRYAFVLDKFNRVVQIEAVGMYDGRVKTKRGAMFGTSFGSLIKKYNAPDGYEISGDTIVMRYLNMDRVAFKLQRVGAKKPHVVTGIVVAAGK
ncbi:MAG: hypothetical protein JSS66_14675 [Armatimonadetes bacterium]|nr:hypothetical protein [Armatimonadota bacterium]